EIEPIGDEPFQADVEFTILPHVGIARGSISPSHFRTTKELAGRRCKDAVMLVVLVHSGRVSVSQYGKELLTGPGTAAVLTSEDPAIASRYTAGQFTTLALSRAALSRALPNPTSFAGTTITAGNPSLLLLKRYVGLVHEQNSLGDKEIAH